MAASSPVSSNKGGDSTGISAILNGNATTQLPTAFDQPKPNLRGMNKPKCIKCGNVARSRCPFQSCKSCCFKAQNPCYIHVLKQNSTLPDKPPPSTSPSVEQPSTDTPTTGASWRLSSLRQLSNSFLNSLRARKPLNKKDFANINKWRFKKLREHIQGAIEVENEAFERYLQNVCLLEETFSAHRAEDNQHAEAASVEGSMELLVSEAKVRLNSDSEKGESLKERIRSIIDEKLKKLKDREHVNDEEAPSVNDPDHKLELKSLKVVRRCIERTAEVNDLLDKLSRARNEEDLKSCMDVRNHLFRPMDTSNELNDGESQGLHTFSYPFPKLCASRNIDDDVLSKVDAEFSLLGQLAQL